MTLNSRDVPAVLQQLTNSRGEIRSRPADLGPAFVVARYLSPRTRETLAEAGASYADATGNLRIFVDRPAVYLEATGATSDPWRGPDRETSTLRGRPAARVVRGLVDFKPPLGIRELSKRSGASLGSTYRTVDFLDKEALLRRDSRGAVVDVAWPDLLLRWSEDYSFQSSNSLSPAFEPRGVARVVDSLRNGDLTVPYAVTGSLAAAAWLVQIAEPRLAMIFTEEPDRLADEAQLRPADAGATNVLLARPFDGVALERTTTEDAVTYTAPSQTAVDLLTSPGRGPAEGEAFIKWMASNEDAWRR